MDAIRTVKVSIDIDFPGFKIFTKKSIEVVNRKNSTNPEIPAKNGFLKYFL